MQTYPSQQIFLSESKDLLERSDQHMPHERAFSPVTPHTFSSFVFTHFFPWHTYPSQHFSKKAYVPPHSLEDTSRAHMGAVERKINN